MESAWRIPFFATYWFQAPQGPSEFLLRICCHHLHGCPMSRLYLGGDTGRQRCYQVPHLPLDMEAENSAALRAHSILHIAVIVVLYEYTQYSSAPVVLCDYVKNFTMRTTAYSTCHSLSLHPRQGFDFYADTTDSNTATPQQQSIYYPLTILLCTSRNS